MRQTFATSFPWADIPDVGSSRSRVKTGTTGTGGGVLLYFVCLRPCDRLNQQRLFSKHSISPVFLARNKLVKKDRERVEIIEGRASHSKELREPMCY